MQAKHGRAGKHKRYQRAAVLALTVLLIILLAGRKRSMPTCSISMSGPGRWLQQASGWALPDRRAVPPGHTCTLNF